MIGVYVPTLGRPHALSCVAANLRESSVFPYRLVFVVEPSDKASVGAAEATGATVLVVESGTYSNAIQAAYEHDESEFFMYANDDFHWLPGWDVNSMFRMTDKDVVGFNDGSPHCTGSTFQLIRRSYIEERSGVVDMPNRVLYPYHHNFVDTEFFETAVHRGVFVYAEDAVVKHLHPDFGLAQVDDTYRKTRARISDDAVLFGSRRHLWGR